MCLRRYLPTMGDVVTDAIFPLVVVAAPSTFPPEQDVGSMKLPR